MWSPDSWKQHPIQQAIHYPDEEALAQVINTLSSLPPLVTVAEIENLKQHLAKATRGECFILQAGDCAERFQDCHAAAITQKLKVMLDVSLVLMQGLDKPIIKLGRIAGQYAKPRTSLIETQDGKTLLSYRGDMINSPEFSKTARTPDPHRLLRAYTSSALTLNYIRALADESFLNLTPRLDFFTSHEALHLPYETALTREIDGHWYNLSTHLPWIGMRTAQMEGAHVEYMSGIQNPIAVKISSDFKASLLPWLIKKLNPTGIPGKLTLIHRLGHRHVRRTLPDLIKAQQDTGQPVLWSCDPMHGNTVKTSLGFKTRYLSHMVSELQNAIEIHRAHHSFLSGIHVELTGENVTECIGGSQCLTEEDLVHAYESVVDPRLNYDQAIEVTTMIARALQSPRTAATSTTFATEP